MTKEYDVLVVVDVEKLKDKKVFDKYLRREGLKEVDGEEFAYLGKSSTPLFHTRAFIHDTLKKALKKVGDFKRCHIVIQLGENPPEGYRYDKEREEFMG